MDLRYTPEDEAFRQEVRGWLDANLPSDKIRSMEERQAWHRKLYDAGYVGMGWPREYGGREAPPDGAGDRRRGDGARQRPGCESTVWASGSSARR